MPTDYYNMTGTPQNSGPGRAVDMRAEFTAIQEAMTKLPPLAGANKLVLSNPAGTGLILQPTGSYVMAGTWTPVLTAQTVGNLTVAYTVQSGVYHRMGQLVFAYFDVVTSTWTHTTASGTLFLTGLPVLPSGPSIGTVQFSGFTKANYTHWVTIIGGGSSTVTFAVGGSAQSRVSASVTDFPTGGSVRIEGHAIYHTNAA